MISGLRKRQLLRNFEKGMRNVQVTCSGCKQVYSGMEAMDSLYVCPSCGKYMTVGAGARIRMVTDAGSFEPWFEDLEDGNPLSLEGYEDKLAAAREKSGSSEAVVIGKGRIFGLETVIGVCDANFMMGSMGHVMGERITTAFENAVREKLPVILFCCSGGARMQEGIISLMQMEKTSAAVKRHSNAGLFYCSILTDPTMGGVTASFATLGDVILAEPGARIGFAGPRVIQQTIGHTLPEGFQKAEFLLEHGMIDGIVERRELKERLAYLLQVHTEEVDKRQLKSFRNNIIAFPNVVSTGEEKTAWEKVKLCRSADRASSLDYMERLFEEFYEMHGDRCYRDDRALIGGLAFFGTQPVTVLADVRGTTLEDRMQRNFGMPMPDGYRKAVRLMKQAEKFRRPVITFINTSGAFCGVDAEERGQGEAIARSIMEMSGLKVPVLCILVGEGGSGGALATAVGNEVWMTENSTYAILSPEGYSSILWKTEQRAEEAAQIMKLTAQDLFEMKVIDRIIPEYGGANHETVDKIAESMKHDIVGFLLKYIDMSGEEIENDRYERFRKF
ncbi:MAG: acetyl-CoA carboxylase carboxyltransferase subunit alpha [Lachnospiraceae bacterium]|nr:acetyl-CoA carboxylase carboxyltransferase subunit alpha [Lachnospiraceae bacterium]